MRDGLGRRQRLVLLGGTSDIGLAIVHQLVRTRGIREVVLAGRDPVRLAAAAARLQLAVAPGPADIADPLDISCVPLDATTDITAVTAAMDRALDGQVDVVVHAIGVLAHHDRTGHDLHQASHVLQVNAATSGTMLLCAAHHLRDQGHGTLVAISSLAAVRARPDNLVYGAAKAGYDALAVGLADELAGTGAGVLVVRPGFVHSHMTRHHRPAPLARHPTDVARAVDAALDRAGRPWGRRIVWVPAPLALVAAAIRAVPAPLLRRAARRLERDGPERDGHGAPPVTTKPG